MNIKLKDLIAEIVIGDFNPLQAAIFDELEKRHGLNVMDLISNDIDKFKLISKTLRDKINELAPDEDSKLVDIDMNINQIKEILISSVEEKLGLVPAMV